MRAAFPKPPDSSLGTPNLFVLNDLLQYMCKCAQTHKSPISKKMNLLYVAIDDMLYSHYSSGEAYPIADYPFPPEPDNVPDYTGPLMRTSAPPSKRRTAWPRSDATTSST